jgi:hypothetical protein
MEREYFVRGRRVNVEQIAGVLAVRLPPFTAEEEGAAVVRSLGDQATVRMREDEREGFARAGWVFVHPNDAVARATESGEVPQAATGVGRVFRHPNGEIMVGTDLLTVKLQPELSEDEAEATLASAGLQVARKLEFASNLYTVRVAGEQDPLDVARDLHGDPAFVYAEPQMIKHVPQRLRPADPDYPQQWQWNNDGSNGGTAGADVDAERAWDVTKGAGARVAVIDRSFDVDHPDLASGITTQSGFFREDAGGDPVFVQGLVGYPDGNHGTGCAGMAAARAGNDEGGCGVAFEAQLLLVACLGDDVGTQETLARAVAYATDPSTEVADADPQTGADVISCSLGPNGDPFELESVLEDAIDFAVTSGRGGLGTPIFWATDNQNVPIAQDEVCSHPGVIAVGRSTRRDTEDDSAFGPELDFLAPGVEVYSTRSEGYRTWTGCSFAAPLAAGVGALVLSTAPGLRWERVRQIMRDTCDKVGEVAYGPDGHEDNYGFGRVNAAEAVRENFVFAAEGRVRSLRVHRELGFGPPDDHISVHVVAQLDSEPDKFMGFPLGDDSNGTVHKGWLEMLRLAFNSGRRVRIEYQRRGLRRNQMILNLQLLA